MYRVPGVIACLSWIKAAAVTAGQDFAPDAQASSAIEECAMTDGRTGTTLSADEVRRLVGDIERIRLEEILATGATLAEIEVAVAWAAGESDVMGAARQPLAGRAAQVYEIIAADSEFPEAP
jgi:cytochrome c553